MTSRLLRAGLLCLGLLAGSTQAQDAADGQFSRPVVLRVTLLRPKTI